MSLALGIAVAFTPLARARYMLYGKSESTVSLFSGTFTAAHLVIVFFRSHLNGSIFKLYPKRFMLAPLLLFGAMMLSSWVMIFIFILSVWWDVYHSSLQTFGFGRIYDAKAGNPSDVGRSLDRGINLLLYAGPIFAGVTLMDHVQHFQKFSDAGSAFFTVIPAWTMTHQKFWVWPLLITGSLYLLYYVYAYGQLARKGYHVSREKVWLLFATGI